MVMVAIVTKVPRVPMALKIDKEPIRCDKHKGNNAIPVIAISTFAWDTDCSSENIMSSSEDDDDDDNDNNLPNTYRTSGVHVEAMMIEKDQVPKIAFPKTTLSTKSWYRLPYRRPTVRSHAML